jgi:aspartate aminotransferase-like enzyme
VRDATIGWVEGLSKRRRIDIDVVAAEGSRSPTVTVISLPKGMAPRELLDAVFARGYTLGSGYGQLRETTVRIGHMGDHTLDGLRRCLHACETAIAELAERRRLTRV